jgi:enoyl-CoA hydratase/carnithine racemase
MHHLVLSPNHAIDFGTMSALEAALDAHDPGLRFELTGGAKAFALGGDLKAFSTLRSKDEGRAMARRMDAILRRIETWPGGSRVIVNGAAYGGGVELLGAFDEVVAVEDAVFGFTQKRFGLPPGWGGMTRLGRRVEEGLLRQWFEEMRVLDASEALAAGLVDGLAGAEGRMQGRMQGRTEGRMDGRMEGRMDGRISDAPLQKAPPNARIDAEIEAFAEAWASDEHHRLVAEFLNRART